MNTTKLRSYIQAQFDSCVPLDNSRDEMLLALGRKEAYSSILIWIDTKPPCGWRMEGEAMNSWQQAERKADELHKALNVLPEHAKCLFNRREGTRSGCRITVTRYSDGMTKTAFVKD